MWRKANLRVPSVETGVPLQLCQGSLCSTATRALPVELSLLFQILPLLPKVTVMQTHNRPACLVLFLSSPSTH
jgi:hypothetical protein